MAFPAVVGTDFSLETVDVTTHDINIPAGESGDRCIVLFAYDTPPETPVWPTGWNQIGQFETSTAVGLEARYRDYDGTEGAAIQVTMNAEESAHETILLDAGTFDAATPPEGLFAGASSGTTPNPPSLDPAAWAAEDTLWIVGGATDASVAFTAYPTNFTDNQHTHTSGGSTGVGIARATRNLNAASEDPGTFAIASTSPWIAVTIAVRPGAAGANVYRLQVRRRRTIRI